ncbi:hypothetical protein C1X89_18130 [Pseudomonas sp. GP01-A8]|nr:hypothetical protein C1X90_20485 [Pseudomonas sp. GP01-A9]PMU28384.1 hypothetical protein C1X88_18685 [Pseudomonas sp. GP01-A13]PMU37391.1 hypothetical protein C1X89_18130 [Pseudomonas sp. GP01-A8]PMU43377.1 hypothetical protein C1X87_31345 [Pseudomonas sp. GP01-A14]PMU52080.1 hypothetical protein C1X85_19880 [Pseudomonas sp. GP01-A6]PMU60078.1 hypothetical protein C1X86_25375 [Pseudomonas sp. GP01-A3]PMU72087.1 hypothetical protein C1X81_17960 [Pseudomonas sp. FW215-L2]PMU78329.1 hypothe
MIDGGLMALHMKQDVSVETVWRGSLLPLGREATPAQTIEILQGYLDRLVWGCCAPQREQAPSPQ